MHNTISKTTPSLKSGLNLEGPIPLGQCADAEPRRPMIPESHERLDKTIFHTLELLNELEQRLGSVLRPEPFSEEEAKQDAMPNPNTLYEKLDASNRCAGYCRDKVQNILRLLEL